MLGLSKVGQTMVNKNKTLSIGVSQLGIHSNMELSEDLFLITSFYCISNCTDPHTNRKGKRELKTILTTEKPCGLPTAEQYIGRHCCYKQDIFYMAAQVWKPKCK